MEDDKKTRRTVLAFAGAVLGTLPLGSKWLIRNASASNDGTVHVVEIRDFLFVPDRLEVKVGDRITWVNRDIVPHTATALDDSWDSGELGRDEEWQTTVEPGMTTAYFCRFHPMMKAMLRILPR